MGNCGGTCGAEIYRDSGVIKIEEYIEGDRASVSVKCPKSEGHLCKAGEKENVCTNYGGQYITDITSELKKFDVEGSEEPLMMICNVRGDKFEIGRDKEGPYIKYFSKNGCKCKNN